MDPQLIAAAKSVDLLALIGRDTELARVAGTQGGEWAGPCPFCGGTDRLHVNPTRSGGARWYCRQCTPRGGDAIDYVQRRNHLSFSEAVAGLVDSAVTLPSITKRETVASAGPPGHPWQGPSWQRTACQMVQRTALALASSEGEPGRTYLAARGFVRETWQAWRLGYTCAWHSGRGAGLPAVTIPWEAKGSIHAVQYRFLPQCFVPERLERDLTKGERFGQRAGGERILFGLDLLDGYRHTLVLVEGELNAVSIWQVCREQAHVLSWGPQSNILRPPVRDVAARIAARYSHVLIWADERGVAEEAARVLGVGERGHLLYSEQGLDANDRLRCGDLGEYLAAHLAF
jgi:DNA primase